MAEVVYSCPVCSYPKLIWRDNKGTTTPPGWFCSQCRSQFPDETELRKKLAAKGKLPPE